MEKDTIGEAVVRGTTRQGGVGGEDLCETWGGLK